MLAVGVAAVLALAAGAVLCVAVLAGRAPAANRQKIAPTQRTAKQQNGTCARFRAGAGATEAVAGGLRFAGVRATYHFYGPAFDARTTACADSIAARPDLQRALLAYPWTASCLEPSWSPGTACGRCLRVRNRATGAAVTARVVDRGGCPGSGGAGLDLDPCAFDAIDTDGAGHRDGHMLVDVQEVRC